MSPAPATGLGRSCPVPGDPAPALTATAVLDTADLRVTEVRCRIASGSGDLEAADHLALVLVRRGTFARHVDGTAHVLDATQAYAINPGEEQRYDHTHSCGDVSTSVRVSPALLDVVRCDQERLPDAPWPSSPAVDLEHRRLLAASRAGDDPDLLHELALGLVATALAQHDGRGLISPAPGRPATVHARRALVASVREALTGDPGLTLTDLAAAHGVSTFHLSRSFRDVTGHTIARHRTRLRVRAALERLGEGEQSLSRLATDTGFADQSHLHRAVRAEAGHTPGELRRQLGRR